jgi:hypothetical protein
VDAAHAAVEAAAMTVIVRLDDLEADGPRDSFWDDLSGAAGAAFDGFQQWMEDNDHWIDGLVTAAGIIGMVLAAVAMFIPGLNVLALTLMVGILAVTSAQAVAGTGTWEDVAYGSTASSPQGNRARSRPQRSSRRGTDLLPGSSTSHSDASWATRTRRRSDNSSSEVAQERAPTTPERSLGRWTS